MATCREGPNSETICTCPTGYQGLGKGPHGCVPAENACKSNPCVHGSCKSHGLDGFSCTCSEGYTGKTFNIHLHMDVTLKDYNIMKIYCLLQVPRATSPSTHAFQILVKTTESAMLHPLAGDTANVPQVIVAHCALHRDNHVEDFLEILLVMLNSRLAQETNTIMVLVVLGFY